MILRHLQSRLIQYLTEFPVVALLGSRQAGKTTLAKSLSWSKKVHYLDLERPSDIAKLSDPELYLSRFQDQLVVLDEIQRVPDLFPVLRSLIDERRQQGERFGHFLLLGSASPDLLRQSSETLAGRIGYLELPPLYLLEVGEGVAAGERHWFRGGYPDSWLAVSDEAAMRWCENFFMTYAERTLPQLGVTATPQQLRRFGVMLAHRQASTLNFAQLGNALDLDGKTVRHYLDLLEGLFLVRTLPAWSRNVGKRLVKAPKVCWRDSGVLHALLGLSELEALLGHPVCGPSWEGYCIEQILNRIALKGTSVDASHYRTHAGAEVDLVLEFPGGDVLAVEIKRTLSPKLTSSLKESMRTLGAQKGVLLIPWGERFPLSNQVEAVPLRTFLDDL